MTMADREKVVYDRIKRGDKTIIEILKHVDFSRRAINTYLTNLYNNGYIARSRASVNKPYSYSLKTEKDAKKELKMNPILNVKVQDILKPVTVEHEVKEVVPQAKKDFRDSFATLEVKEGLSHNTYLKVINMLFDEIRDLKAEVSRLNAAQKTTK